MGTTIFWMPNPDSPVELWLALWYGGGGIRNGACSGTVEQETGFAISGIDVHE
ncbi:MAG: hypothetical protein FWD57_12800 [Polyangiaceae bacterium]|nr:hypothetical protein [Polyangiaceae bacterium]